MTTLKKIFSLSTLALLTALILSGIAAWYSILGLTAIFAAAVIPIIIMGASLEIAKVVTTVWLHRYWDKCKLLMKVYLSSAVAVLALITSMGIFGFLSKAHLDQTLPTGDVAAQIQLLDEKITIQREYIKSLRENIDANRLALSQLDAQVNARLERGTTENSAERAVQIRRQQTRERAALNTEIGNSQKRIEEINKTIEALNIEKAPLAASYRKIEAEVGPVKYIAALIYGDNPDVATLERAVRWVIILLIFVFDPLALMLVIAAISSYRWEKEKDATPKPQVITADLETTADTVQSPVQQDKSETETQDIPVKKKVRKPKEQPAQQVQAEPEVVKYEENVSQTIATEGVTPIHDQGNGYVEFENKLFQKNALKELRPDLFSAKADVLDPRFGNSNFGTVFPKIAKKGDVYVRVDALPNQVYKFDGYKWIQQNKNVTQTYLYNDQYIEYLIEKINEGVYDIDSLTDFEKQEIENYLTNKQNK